MFKNVVRVSILLGFLATLAACGDTTGVGVTNQKQEEITDTAALAVPFPKITKFQELKILSKLYEVRDQSDMMFTYSEAMDGSLTKICNSLGFGIPYGTQFSNPEKLQWNSSSGYANIPQAEPNGAYTGTATTDATWVLCFGPGGVYPFYWEGTINVSPVEISGPRVKEPFVLNFQGKVPVITNKELAEIQKSVTVTPQARSKQ